MLFRSEYIKLDEVERLNEKRNGPGHNVVVFAGIIIVEDMCHQCFCAYDIRDPIWESALPPKYLIRCYCLKNLYLFHTLTT